MTLWQGDPPKGAPRKRPEAPGPPAEPSPELVDLYARVETGIAWLVEHDPTGAFHLMFEAGLSPLSPMPAQSAARVEDWRAYHDARTLFERLWRKMVALENR